MSENKELVNVEKDTQKNWEETLETQTCCAPMVDIYETDDDYVLLANMPGVKREDVHIKLEDGSLVLMGKINYDEATKRKYILNENEVANYYRRFRISENIDSSKIEAKFENGQLTVKLPKHDRIKPRIIKIQ